MDDEIFAAAAMWASRNASASFRHYSSQHQYQYQYRRSRPILPRRYYYLSYYFAYSQIDNNTLA